MGVGLLTSTSQDQANALAYSSGQYNEPKEPGITDDFFYSIPQSIKHGLDTGASALADYSMPFIEKAAPEQIATWFDEQRKVANQSMRDTRADPRTMGTLGQIAHGLGTFVTQAAPGAVAGFFSGGPVGAVTGSAISAGSLSAYDRYDEIFEKTKNKDVAFQSAWLTGVVTAAGVALPPFAGARLSTQIASGIGINVGLGGVERGGQSAILEDSGYTELASQYKVLDQTAILIDGILGAAIPVGARMFKPTEVQVPIKDVDMAMTGQNGVVSRTRDPMLQTTNEGIDAKLSADLEISRQIMEEGRAGEDLTVAHEAVKDTVPNPTVAEAAIKMSNVFDEMQAKEIGISAREIEAEITSMNKIVNEPEVAPARTPDVEATAKPAEETAKARTEPADFNNNKANEIAKERPDMKVATENGIMTAREAIVRAEADYKQAQKETSLYDVAVACAIGVGE